MGSHNAADGSPPGSLSHWVEIGSACTSAAFRLFAANLSYARNFCEMSSIPFPSGDGARLAPASRGQPVIEIERDGRIGIDLKFGSITFKEEGNATFAEALVDVLVAAADMSPDSDTRVQMSIKIAADPDRDTILGVTEAIRSHIVKTLRAAADTLDEASARTLLFYQPEAA